MAKPRGGGVPVTVSTCSASVHPRQNASLARLRTARLEGAERTGFSPVGSYWCRDRERLRVDLLLQLSTSSARTLVGSQSPRAPRVESRTVRRRWPIEISSRSRLASPGARATPRQASWRPVRWLSSYSPSVGWGDLLPISLVSSGESDARNRLRAADCP